MPVFISDRCYFPTLSDSTSSSTLVCVLTRCAAPPFLSRLFLPRSPLLRSPGVQVGASGFNPMLPSKFVRNEAHANLAVAESPTFKYSLAVETRLGLVPRPPFDGLRVVLCHWHTPAHSSTGNRGLGGGVWHLRIVRTDSSYTDSRDNCTSHCPTSGSLSTWRSRVLPLYALSLSVQWSLHGLRSPAVLS